MAETSLAHPASRLVPVCGGAHEVRVRPWTMAQRAELKPRLSALLSRVQELEGDLTTLNLATLFNHAEEEIYHIVRASVVLPEGLTWDELDWEDLPSLAQAVWEISVVRMDGGGLAGKLVGVLVGAVQRAAVHAQLKSPPRSTKKSSPAPSSAGSPSSPADGAPTQSA